MNFFNAQNPGIGGLEELSPSEEVFVMNLNGLAYERGDILYYNGSALTVLHPGVSGYFLKTNGIDADPEWSVSGGASVPEDSFGIVVDGGGSVISTGSKGFKYIPWDCTITGWDIRSDISGDCVINIKRAGISIAGTEKPTLSSSSSDSDLTLTTWTTSLVAGDIIEFVVDSAATLTQVTATILVNKV